MTSSAVRMAGGFLPSLGKFARGAWTIGAPLIPGAVIGAMGSAAAPPSTAPGTLPAGGLPSGGTSEGGTRPEWADPDQAPATAPPAPGEGSIGGLGDILERIIAAEERARARAGVEYGPRTAIDVEAFKQRAAVAQANALERMEAKTQRDVELSTIDSWTKVTQAQIDRDTQLARAMMQTAMVMGVPNANLIAATAPIAQQAAAAYKPGTAVF